MWRVASHRPYASHSPRKVQQMTTVKVKKESTDREARWENLLVEYEKKNPVKFAAKKARGEFDKIPDNFV